MSSASGAQAPGPAPCKVEISPPHRTAKTATNFDLLPLPGDSDSQPSTGALTAEAKLDLAAFASSAGAPWLTPK